VKYCFSIFFALLVVKTVQAQNDSLTVFREPSKTNAKNNAIALKNAVNFNLMQLIRGGVLISYERALSSQGFAITAGAGINKFDAIGQVYWKEFSYYYKLDTEVEREGTKIKPLLDFGLKFYTLKTLGGPYLQLSFTMIENSVKVQKNSDSQNYTLPENSNFLDYRSNELKFLFGFTNSNDKVFYHDFNIGIGYRFIQYQKYKINETINQTGTSYQLTKNSNSNQTPWFFITWKMGRRF
jgi:hypothetical protein